MTRAHLEHLIRAAATIADDREIVVIGSQAVLGQFPNAPAEMCVSRDADLFPRHHPERADMIDGPATTGLFERAELETPPTMKRCGAA